MKVLLAGNMANLGYFYTKLLRSNGIDVKLLMEKNPPPVSDPLNFDESLKGKYPTWVKFYDKSSKFWSLQIIREMRKKEYDIIHAFVELPSNSFTSAGR